MHKVCWKLWTICINHVQPWMKPIPSLYNSILGCTLFTYVPAQKKKIQMSSGKSVHWGKVWWMFPSQWAPGKGGIPTESIQKIWKWSRYIVCSLRLANLLRYLKQSSYNHIFIKTAHGESQHKFKFQWSFTHVILHNMQNIEAVIYFPHSGQNCLVFADSLKSSQTAVPGQWTKQTLDRAPKKFGITTFKSFCTLCIQVHWKQWI